MINIMEDMASDLLDLMQNRLDSFAKWDLLRFLYRHPDRAYSAEELAWELNRKGTNLEDEIDALVAAGLVERRWVASRPAFALTRDPARRQLVKRFVQSCADQRLRLEFAYYTLRNMNAKQHRPSHKRPGPASCHILAPTVGRRRLASATTHR